MIIKDVKLLVISNTNGIMNWVMGRTLFQICPIENGPFVILKRGALLQLPYNARVTYKSFFSALTYTVAGWFVNSLYSKKDTNGNIFLLVSLLRSRQYILPHLQGKALIGCLSSSKSMA